MTTTENNLLTKIILETATREDFLSVTSNFEEYRSFLAREDVAGILTGFGLGVGTTSTNDLEITDTHPLYNRYTVSRRRGTFNIDHVADVWHRQERM